MRHKKQVLGVLQKLAILCDTNTEILGSLTTLIKKQQEILNGLANTIRSKNLTNNSQQT